MSDSTEPNEAPPAPTASESQEQPQRADADASSSEQRKDEEQPRPAQAEKRSESTERSDDRPRILARYGLLGTIGVFTHTKKTKFEDGSKLVLQTDRGIEIGQHVPVPAQAERNGVLDLETIRHYLDQTNQERAPQREGRVLRVAADQDLAEERHINANVGEQLAFCQKLIDRHGLPMKLITCEHLFGGERMVFYFMAEGRVDFRQLVRDLAREYQTRIEMRQVGARDEARLVADYEICGRECCCKNFLKTLRPVSMKMAKMQKATLDPSKVSGRCGRLRCCLRFEHEVYSDLNQRLARNNAWVSTPEGEGKVVDRQIITQLVTVELEDRRRVTYPMEEVEVLAKKPPARPQEPAKPSEEKETAPDRTKHAGEQKQQQAEPSVEPSRGPRKPDAAPEARPDRQPQPEPVEDRQSPPAHQEPVPPVEREPEPKPEPTQDKPGPEAEKPTGESEDKAPQQTRDDTAQSGKKRRSRGRRRRRRSRKSGNGDKRNASKSGNRKQK